MQVTALKEIRYAGENRHPGERFEVSDKDAKILVAIGKVALYIAPAPKAKPVEKKAVPVESAGKYRRRDMLQ